MVVLVAPGLIAFWKGSLRWQSFTKWHLTLSCFWPKLAWDEESSNLNQSRPSSRKEDPLTRSSIFSAVAQNKLLFQRTVRRQQSPFLPSGTSLEKSLSQLWAGCTWPQSQ